MSDISARLPRLLRAGPVPIYQQIQDWMRLQIGSGLWPEHYKLDSEVDLAIALEVSRGTIRRAIAGLIEQGLLVQIQGRGTFVTSCYLEQPLTERLVSFSEDLIYKGIPYETEVIEQAVIQPSQRVASLLALSPGRRVLVLRRRRTVGGKPLIFLHNFLPLDRCPGIEQIDFSRYRLFEVLEEILGLKLDWARRFFQAQAATGEVAALLDIAPRDPVLYMQQVLYQQDGQPIELSDLWFRGDSFRLSAAVTRRSATAQQRTSYETQISAV
jgi:DNA-binding GntR family transcriptional regulator